MEQNIDDEKKYHFSSYCLVEETIDSNDLFVQTIFVGDCQLMAYLKKTKQS